jgi:hypothetical protein
MFRRNNTKTDAGSVSGTDVEGSVTSFSSHSPDARLQEKTQDVMKDNLELMKDIVMKIREDPEFASNIYSNCPRLQHLLNQHPDLRPVFEDPKLVRINFEQVYRDAGGVLPEDEEKKKKKKKSWLVWLVNSPFFKVLRLVLFVKKLVMCIAGGGFAFITGCCLGCCFEDALEEVDTDPDVDINGTDPNQEALNKAAEHMEDPEVQEQMQRLLEDPENLQQAIENDNELRALRDSNPLCAELMSDPETMRVLTDPDNLRALGEAPALIEADFIDPDSFSPDVIVDIETGGAADLDVADGGDGEYDTGGDDAVGDFDEADGDAADAEGDDEDDEDEWWDDAELEAQDVGNDAGDTNVANEGGNNARAQARSQARQQQEQSDNGAYGMRGFMASVGVAATDLLAAQIVGNIFGDDNLPGGLGGGGGNLEVVDDIGDAADAVDVINDDVTKVVEDTHDEVHDTANESRDVNGALDLDMGTDDNGKRVVGDTAGAATSAGAIGGTTAIVTNRGVNDSKGENKIGDAFDYYNEEKETEEGPKKSKIFFGTVNQLGLALSTATQEYIASAALGEDFGEEFVERIGKKGDDDKYDKQKGGDDNKDEDFEEVKSKPRGFFGRELEEPNLPDQRK